jgi:hypothetical protein
MLTRAFIEGYIARGGSHSISSDSGGGDSGSEKKGSDESRGSRRSNWSSSSTVMVKVSIASVILTINRMKGY